MRGFLVFLLVLGLGAAVGDRVAERIVLDRAEDRLAAQGLAGPQVEVGGVAFLPQLLSREFDDVQVSARSLAIDGTRASRVRATAQTVTALGSARLRARAVQASALIAYDEVLRRAGVRGVRMQPMQDGRVRLRGDLTVLGRAVPVTAVGRVDADGRRLRIVPESVGLADGATVDPALTTELTERFTVTYRLRELPDGLRLRAVTPRESGFLVEVAGSEVSIASTAP